MDPSFKIRDTYASDFRAVAALLQAADFADLSPLDEDAFARIISRDICYVVENPQKEVVGTVSVMHNGATRGTIYDLAVDPEYRGRERLGTRLFARAIEDIFELGFPYVEAVVQKDQSSEDYEKSIRFFENFGMERRGMPYEGNPHELLQELNLNLKPIGKLIIRRAEPKDFEGVQSVLENAGFSDKFPISQETFNRIIRRDVSIVAALPPGMGRDSGRVIGTVSAMHNGATRSMIYDLALDPEARQSGLGRVMIKAVLTQLVSMEIPYVEAVVQRTEASGFFEKLGFEPGGAPFRGDPLRIRTRMTL